MANLSASEQFENEAVQWEKTGQLGWSGQNEYAFVKLRCWIASDGAKRDGVSQLLQSYLAAAERSFEDRGPDWYDEFLATRDSCSLCGETYRLENLRFCTHCTSQICYCRYIPSAHNGNPKCPICPKGELVG